MPQSAMSQGEILVAIKFDANTPNLVMSAMRIAAASHHPLRLVHVFSPELPRYGLSRQEYIADLSDPNVDVSNQQDPQDAPTSHLDFWAEDHGPAKVVGTRGQTFALTMDAAERQLKAYIESEVKDAHSTVLLGEFPDALNEYAALTGAAMIIAGAALKNPGLLRSKLRQTYRLMARASVPVLVLPDSHQPLDPVAAPFRLLIGDDLTMPSLAALKAVEKLVLLLKQPAYVLHLHVKAASPARSPRQVAGDDALDLSATPKPEVARELRLLHNANEKHLARLNDRAHSLRRHLESLGGTYSAKLWQGRVAEELSRAAHLHSADISAFGRHQMFHRQPMTLGKLPFGAMLGLDTAILVAPPWRS